MIFLKKGLKQNQPGLVKGLLWSWILITFGICGMDLALGVIFGIDYGRFNRQAYMYNLSNIYEGPVDAAAAQLLAGMVVSMAMIIISLKGFVLWIANVGFLLYLSIRAICIGQERTTSVSIIF